MTTKDTAKKDPGTKERKPVRRKKSDEQEVEFSYFAPEAKSVHLAGKFNDWDTRSIPMRKSKEGTWKVKLPLASGRYEYKFFVDQKWSQDVATGTETVPNPFGSNNSVIGVE